MTQFYPPASLVTNHVPPQLAVIVPSYNERDNIELLYRKIAAALIDMPWEMIVVDDNSPDGTADLTWDLARRMPNVRCLKRVGRRGLSSAVIEGMLSTNAAYVAVIDGDLQHDETILPELFAKLQAGADIAIGTRYSGQGSTGEGFSRFRAWGSRTATKMSALIAGQPLSDPMSGFFAARRDLILSLAPHLSSEGFKILLDLAISAGRLGTTPVVAEVPYTFRPRHSGESKMNPLVAVQFAGLWMSKLTGGALPPSFLLFGLVGGTGVVVHLLTLSFFTSALAQGFVVSQIAATITAMAWNFVLNNNLTYADRKLRGTRLITGFLSFCLICALGGVANISVANAIYQWDQQTFVAGFSGAVMSSVFNYAVTRAFTWK